MTREKQIQSKLNFNSEGVFFSLLFFNIVTISMIMFFFGIIIIQAYKMCFHRTVYNTITLDHQTKMPQLFFYLFFSFTKCAELGGDTINHLCIMKGQP